VIRGPVLSACAAVLLRNKRQRSPRSSDRHLGFGDLFRGRGLWRI